MIISWNWLTDYLRLDMPVDELTDRLALTGLNHESTQDVGGDLAIDLEVTSNRPDCLGHLGVAREISVIFELPSLRIREPKLATSGGPVESLASVVVEEPALCPRFTARLITGVEVRESPWWLRKRLETLGVRPVNNIADVTNYVMFERGQPLHAYDFDKLGGNRIIVRRARPGEKFKAINGKTYELTPEMLAIADANEAVGLAGVMGGLDSEIGDGTRRVLIEAAQFDPICVRRTSRALGLSSAASYRFERPMDPEGVDWSSRRCAELILETAGGTLHPGVIDVGQSATDRPTVRFRLEQFERVIGIPLDRERIISILESLGLERRGDLEFRAPSWRHDLDREIDLIEEVARVHGYEHIPEDRPVPLTKSSKGPRERVEAIVREALTGAGLDEAYTFSLVEPALAVSLAPLGQGVEPIRFEHATRKKENVLRPSLLPSLLAARKHNEAHGTPDADLFEIAQVYLPRAGEPIPVEPARLAFAVGGDFFGAKGIVEVLLERLHVAGRLEARPAPSAIFAPGISAALHLGDQLIGWVGEIDPARFGLRGACSGAELELGVLIAAADLIPQQAPVPAFPGVARDLSLVVERSLPWGELAGVAREAAGPLLEALEYRDAFRGKDIPEEMQSVHFGLRFRHPERTLTGDEVDRAMRQVVDACAARFRATLRA